MPIFEYKCNKCLKDFELLVFGDKKVRCPYCNSDDLKKKFSLFAMSGVEKPFAGSSTCSACSSRGSGCSTCG